MTFRHPRFVAFLSLTLALCGPLHLAADETEVETALSFNSDGVSIQYAVHGDGEPLVLIHGFAGDDDQWSSYVEPLSENFRIITMDCRGHGDSGKPQNTGAYGPRLVEDVVHLLDHLEISKAHIAGYSMGGMITLAAIERHPDRFISAVVGGYGWAEDPGELERAIRIIASDIENGRGFKSMIETLLPPDTEIPVIQIDMINALLMERNDMKALASAIRSFPQLRPDTDALRTNTVPTLALIGEHDVFVEEVQYMDTYMGELDVDVIEDANHMSTFISPRFYASMEQFLRSHHTSNAPVTITNAPTPTDNP